jgi:hypothetical protein
MREPYRTLFAGYEEHWLFKHYLLGDEPDWGGLLADERLPGLSGGEKVLLDMACWFAGPRHHLDNAHRLRIAQAMLLTCDG